MSSPKHYPTFRISQSAALEKSRQVKTSSGMLCKGYGRLDQAASTAAYYIQFITPAAAGGGLPGDGAVTHLITPIKINHTNTNDDNFDFDFSPDFLKFQNGLYIVASTTEFTKSIIGSNWLSCTAFYR